MQKRDLLVESAYDVPAEGLEQDVAKIIAEVLGVDRVGRHDSFFELGGTSMDAIRVCARIERLTDRVVEPSWLLDHDELSDFAAQIGVAVAGSETASQ